VKIKPARPLAGLAAVLAVACITAPRPAHAEIYLSTNAGGACKPAYGASDKFTFTELYAQNIGTTDQYLVCNFANFTISTGQLAAPIDELRVWAGAGATPGTLACTVKMGYWLGSPVVTSTSTKSAALGISSTGMLDFVSTDLPRDSEYQVLSMNCKLPGGFKLGLIQRFEHEPTSGNGWTP